MPYAIPRRTLVAAAAWAPLITAACNPRGVSESDDPIFAEIARRYLDDLARASPVYATNLGDHRFDDKLDDLSPQSQAARRISAQNFLDDVSRLDPKRLSRANQVDAAILENQLRYDLWTDQTLQPLAWDPLVYNSIAGGALYNLMAREFAPLPVRLRAAATRMELLPRLLAQARTNLIFTRVPKIHAETYAGQNPGLVSLVDDLVLKQASGLSGSERDRLNKAADGLKKAVEEHQGWIEDTLVPNAAGDFRLGAALYDQKLAFALHSPLSRAEIKARAEQALTATRDRMYGLARQALAGRPGMPPAPDQPTDEERKAVIKAALDLAAADHPTPETLVDTSKRALEAATAFVRQKDLITLPDAPVEVILMPEFQRGVAVAHCDAPGPLDKELPTFYAVSPIPEGWTAERAQSFLREYNTRMIHDIAVHEAMPGHFVQLAIANQASSTLRAVLSSGPFVEGWGVYAEEMMADQGFLGGDPLYKLTQLKMMLRVATNAVLDIGVHVEGMSQEAAMRLMMDGAFQEEGEAAGKWIRACVSSAQLPTYFVGFAEHKAALAEAQKREGFTLKGYHDQILSYGSPPVRFARALMLDEPIA